MILNVTNDDDYMIASALRGPDRDDYDLKRATTAVLRYLVGMRECQYADVVAPSIVVSHWQPEVASKFSLWENVHFVDHFSHALEILVEKYNSTEAQEYALFLYSKGCRHIRFNDVATRIMQRRTYKG